jgi:ubiquinone/menaquinone biosynthesis C-methylase UbiE
VLPEQRLKSHLLERANIQPGDRVLDLGCGTGTLALMLKRAAPGAVVTGLDADEEILGIARAKADEAGLDVSWDRAFAHDLPYPGASFDVVISSLMIHHLDPAQKQRTFQEIHRVLRPSGELHILDFGRPFNPWTRFLGMILARFEQVADNFAGQIVPMLSAAGFLSAVEEEPQSTIIGPLWFYRAQRSNGGRG